MDNKQAPTPTGTPGWPPPASGGGGGSAAAAAAVSTGQPLVVKPGAKPHVYTLRGVEVSEFCAFSTQQ